MVTGSAGRAHPWAEALDTVPPWTTSPTSSPSPIATSRRAARFMNRSSLWVSALRRALELARRLVQRLLGVAVAEDHALDRPRDGRGELVEVRGPHHRPADREVVHEHVVERQD